MSAGIGYGSSRLGTRARLKRQKLDAVDGHGRPLLRHDVQIYSFFVVTLPRVDARAREHPTEGHVVT